MNKSASDAKRDRVLDVLRKNREDLKSYGATSISVFGSVARGEAGPGSDVDLLVEVDDRMTLFRLSRLKNHLQELLGLPVDLVTPGALRPHMRETILAEAIRAA
ncbi:nucleotidyltransferase family protein [Longimicrobium sp.]|uniref:nucleotidyltransferase family protein n=1 Tax=Longimicrobium sp. TaxID=2029185 RepID=UPI002C0AC2FA|nr:nucleotidyltransferase family protein [Longimicrobium sp.]HSU17707.1 nucleotidyltransferase family protein [Longimicrobium sp.]